MKCKTVCAVYFSATGTTEKITRLVAEKIASAEKAELKIVDFTLPAARQGVTEFGPEDLVIFGAPTYAGRLPNLMMPFIRDGFKGSNTPAVPVVLYGNRNYDDSLMELRNLLEAAGFRTIAGAAFIGEHSFSYELAAGRPDEQDLVIAEKFAQSVFEKFDALKELPSVPAAVGGCDPIRPYYTPRDRAGNPVNILKVKPKTSEACDRCGICAEVCPMGSISKEDPTVVAGICIKCGACVKKCPKKAKYYDDEKFLYHEHELEAGYARRAEPEFFL